MASTPLMVGDNMQKRASKYAHLCHNIVKKSQNHFYFSHVII